jgi:hypothetical protein
MAVQRAYGRPILAGLHGVWSVALFAGGAVGAVAAAAGLSPTWQFAVVAAVLAIGSAPLLAWQLPEADEPPPPAERSGLPVTRVLALGAIGFAAFVGEGAAADWSAIYARDRLGAWQRSRGGGGSGVRHRDGRGPLHRATGRRRDSVRFGSSAPAGQSLRPVTCSWSRCRTWRPCTSALGS